MEVLVPAVQFDSPDTLKRLRGEIGLFLVDLTKLEMELKHLVSDTLIEPETY